MSKRLLNIFKKRKEPRHFFYTSDFLRGGMPNPNIKGIGGMSYRSEARSNMAKIGRGNFQYLFQKGEPPVKIEKVTVSKDIETNLANYHGGSIVFPSNKYIDSENLYIHVLDSLNRLDDLHFVKCVNTKKLHEEPPVDPIKDIMESYDNNHIATFAIGNFFTGSYARDPGNNKTYVPSEYLFNKESLVVEFNCISYKGIQWLALYLAIKMDVGMLVVKTSNYSETVIFVYKEPRKYR